MTYIFSVNYNAKVRIIRKQLTIKCIWSNNIARSVQDLGQTRHVENLMKIQLHNLDKNNHFPLVRFFTTKYLMLNSGMPINII